MHEKKNHFFVSFFKFKNATGPQIQITSYTKEYFPLIDFEFSFVNKNAHKKNIPGQHFAKTKSPSTLQTISKIPNWITVCL